MKSFRFEFEAIGTKWVIDVLGGDLPKKDLILQKINQTIEDFDLLYSRFHEDSLITRMSRKKGTYTFSKEGAELLALYKKLYDLSDGSFTPLIGKVLEEAGYDSSYSLLTKKIHNVIGWEEVISVNGSDISLKKPVLLDFGAAGKGCLIDAVAQMFADLQIYDFCIDAGGDILQKSSQIMPITVGLEHPVNPKQVIGTIQIINESVCASAGNKRKWGEYHHLMNPHTLKPQNSVLATWVVADNAMVADGLATALFFIEPSVLQKLFSFKYIVVYPDFSVAKSSDITVDFYK